MKLSFSLKDKKASLDVDVEKLIEKGLDLKAQNPSDKTQYQIRQEEKRKNKELKLQHTKKNRYQIRQEEKRKNEELKQKHFIQGMLMMFFVLAIALIVCFVGSTLTT